MTRLRFRFRYLRHPISLFGVWLTTVSAVMFLVVFAAELMGVHTNPYIGIVFFLVLPGLFVLGLLLIPLGLWLMRRRERRGRAEGIEWPVVDMNVPHTRFLVMAIAGATLVNIVVLSLAAYRGVEYMDSASFCGQVCHTVMEPEFTAYQHGPHARVACVHCHIGPGAPWFVKSKLSGTRQLFAVALHTYPTPIPSPVENLRPARDTCEQCHWPEKFTGDRIRQVFEYADDEANTETVTSLRLHVGSGQQRLGATGIHWHMAPSTRVTYITTDPKRQTIPYVRVEDARGRVIEYRTEGVTDEELAKGERRLMDCMDCHNRPSHRFDPDGRERGERGDVARRDPQGPAVHPPRSGRRARGAEGTGRGGAGGDGGAADRLLPLAVPTGLGRPAGRHRARGRGRPGSPRPQRLSTDAGEVGKLPQPHRPRQRPGVFPLPRRCAPQCRRPGHRPGLLDVPHDGVTRRSSCWGAAGGGGAG